MSETAAGQVRTPPNTSLASQARHSQLITLNKAAVNFRLDPLSVHLAELHCLGVVIILFELSSSSKLMVHLDSLRSQSSSAIDQIG